MMPLVARVGKGLRPRKIDMRRSVTVLASTPGLQSRRVAFTEIPIIDFSPMQSDDQECKERMAKEICRACTEVGFLYIKNHGVPRRAIEDLFSASREFFSLDDSAK